jgi:transposase
VLTERARRWAFDQVGGMGRTVAAVARDLGVGWHTVMETVRQFGEPLVDALSLEGVSALGMDEHRWRHRPHGWAVGFCDLDTGRLIDIIEGRSGAGISRYLADQPAETRARVVTVSVDPWRGYLRPVRRLLPQAQVVVDHFHLIRLANQVVTEVRQRTQQEVTGHRGRKGDPLYGIRHLLLRGRERLSEAQCQRIADGLDDLDGDRWDEIASAWTGKELLRDVYASETVFGARQALRGFYDWVEEVEVPELSRLGRTVRQWEGEILAYHRQRHSNAKTETANLIVEKQRRSAHGYRNFTNYRLRLLLHHGVKWDTHATTKIRGRKPPLVA